MPYRWTCLRLLFLLVLLFGGGGLGALRAEVSEPDSLRGERISAFDREKLERNFSLVRFRSSAQASYALDLSNESWYLGSVKMDTSYKEFARDYIAPWKLIPTGERDVVEAYYDGSKDPFDDEYGGKNSRGKTQNLMDYTEGATEFATFRWNVMANTALFTALDREKEA